MSGRPFLVVTLLLVIVFFPPLMRWPMTHLSAYAEAHPARGKSAAALLDRLPITIDGYAVATSNENERREREQQQGREDNQHEDNENDDWTPPPPPRVQAQPASPPPPAAQVQACLQNGQSVTLMLSDGSATVKVFQSGVSIELSKVDAGGVPPPPDGIVGDLVFRLAAGACGGTGLDVLPGAVNLGVGYRNRVGERVDKNKLTLMLLDGGAWTAAPGSQPDPQNNYVSASVTGLGVYAVVQR
jgi:hypothetical protein